jgi:hypothetical protein
MNFNTEPATTPTLTFSIDLKPVKAAQTPGSRMNQPDREPDHRTLTVPFLSMSFRLLTIGFTILLARHDENCRVIGRLDFKPEGTKTQESGDRRFHCNPATFFHAPCPARQK